MGGVALFLTVLLFHSRTSIPSAVSCHLLTESSFDVWAWRGIRMEWDICLWNTRIIPFIWGGIWENDLPWLFGISIFFWMKCNDFLLTGTMEEQECLSARLLEGVMDMPYFPSPSVIEIVVSYNLQQDIMDRWPKRWPLFKYNRPAQCVNERVVWGYIHLALFLKRVLSLCNKFQRNKNVRACWVWR